jgi:hypothetical protein
MPSSSTEAYETLRAVVGAVQTALASYINSNSSTVHPLIYSAGRTTPHPFNHSVVIYSAAKPLRNVMLTQERVGNLILSCHNVGDILQLASRHMDERDLRMKLLAIRDELQAGLDRNLELSKSFNKKHCSYLQSRSLHKSAYSVYFKMTLFQSRATDIYESELERLVPYLDACYAKLGKGVTLDGVRLSIEARERRVWGQVSFSFGA